MWPPYGGAAVRSLALLSRIPSWDIRVLAPGPLPPGLAGVVVPRAGAPAGRFNRDVLNLLSLPFFLAARRLSDQHPPDVVCAFGIWSMIAALAAAGSARIVLDLAHIETATARETRLSRPLLPLLRALEVWAVHHASGVVVVSAEDRERLLDLLRPGAPPVSVVSNGVDRVEIPCRPASAASMRFAAIFVGRMSFVPNRQSAEFLAREVAPSWPEGRFLIVGEAPPSSITGVPGVEVTGAAPDLAPLYARAGAACAPVFSGSGVRNKVLEAGCYGLPLVATKKAVEGLDLSPGIHFFRAETATEFADALRHLARDEHLRGRLAEALRARVFERYLWDDQARAFDRCLKNAAHS